jgi:sugar/nucleoside kinase (ribokinase family)
MKLHRIAVIGTINRDLIIHGIGDCNESLGGILYNVLALAEVGTGLLEITPVSYIGADAQETLFTILNGRDGISLEGITSIPGKTNVNRLTYVNENERKEVVQFHTPAISFEMIEPYLDHDILLFNFISGHDVSLETLRRVRKRTDATIYCDVHSLVLSPETGEERTFCTVEDWPVWARQIDMIQMNMKELFYFTGNTDHGRPFDERAVHTAMKQLLDLGPGIVITTAGNRGVYLGTPHHFYQFSQKYTAPVRDTTGCGDIFTATFLAKLLVSGDPSIACDYANTLAGLATCEEGIKKCFSLKHSSPLSVNV